jgi:hypothetical protein
MQETVSALLAKIGASSSFATRHTAAPDDLSLKVNGVGRLRLPITAASARKLCAVARPARHGFKDQTRLDTAVRDTWEIARRGISIDQPRWNRTLLPQLERIRRELGLPEGCCLEACLHNLLVYAPGQFFIPHQDSEKMDGMVGSLIVTLPSQFTGGALVIEHHDGKKVIGGSAQKLTFAAFYADCHHEVRPVKQGYRVALTYNLLSTGHATVADRVSANRIEVLVGAVHAFFHTPFPPRFRGDTGCKPPDRLVYLLDHEYTQRGLTWSSLKGPDSVRAEALREVARQLDCEIFLALADVHETWNCEDDYRGKAAYGRRFWHDDEDEEESDDVASSNPELTDLLDSDVELRHWVGIDGRAEKIAAGVADGELCYTKPSIEFEPFESKYEGFMGNWGNTVDHWYHRAAIVLWPRARTFVIRARASASWALGEVAKVLKAGNVQQARVLAQSLLPFWTQTCHANDTRGLFDRTMKVAVKLGDPALAAALLQPFALTRLTPTPVLPLAKLLGAYGLEWCRALLLKWTSENKVELPQTRLHWLGSSLADLCRSLCEKGATDGPSLAQWILAEQWSWLLKESRQIREHLPPHDAQRELAKQCNAVLGVIEGALIARHPELHREILQVVVAEIANGWTSVGTGLLRLAHESRPRKDLRGLGLMPVHESCSRVLTTCLSTPARAKNDWSIPTPLRCRCKLCAALVVFLRERDKVRVDWPLAQTQRAHIHSIAGLHNLPITHVTRRTGRPFTLVLQKTDAVFKREAAERLLWKSELQWLKRTAEDF